MKHPLDGTRFDPRFEKDREPEIYNCELCQHEIEPDEQITVVSEYNGNKYRNDYHPECKPKF